MLKYLSESIERLHCDQRGQGMAEYGLIIALVAVAAIIAFQTLGKGISTKVDRVNQELQ